MTSILRKATAALCIPVLRITGWRFSRHHRHNETLVYRLVDTVGANFYATRS
jgi:hypothetical protein